MKVVTLIVSNKNNNVIIIIIHDILSWGFIHAVLKSQPLYITFHINYAHKKKKGLCQKLTQTCIRIQRYKKWIIKRVAWRSDFVDELLTTGLWIFNLKYTSQFFSCYIYVNLWNIDIYHFSMSIKVKFKDKQLNIRHANVVCVAIYYFGSRKLGMVLGISKIKSFPIWGVSSVIVFFFFHNVCIQFSYNTFMCINIQTTPRPPIKLIRCDE